MKINRASNRLLRSILIILISCIAGVTATVVIASFPDVPPDYWAYNDINWLQDNGISTGFPDGTYHPEEYVTRAEMAAFLHRTAGVIVAAGIHVSRTETNSLFIDRWFNNVNGDEPILSGSAGLYEIDMGFDVSQRYVVATIDTNYVDTRNAVITVSTPGGNTVRVRINDPEGGEQAGEFFLQVY